MSRRGQKGLLSDGVSTAWKRSSFKIIRFYESGMRHSLPGSHCFSISLTDEIKVSARIVFSSLNWSSSIFFQTQGFGSDRPLNSASKLTLVGLSPGPSGDFGGDLHHCECFKWKTRERTPRGKPHPLYNLISKVTLHHLCLILFVGSTSTPMHTRTWINRKQVPLRSMELAGPTWWCQFLNLGGDYVIALWLFIGLYVFCTLFYKMLSFTIKIFLIKNKQS